MYTFADRDRCLYTVTNVPETIKLPPGPDTNPIENKSLRELLTPRYAIAQAPELPYILRSPPINDPLLGRLSLEVANLYPIQFDNRLWGLPLPIKKAWDALEKALGFVTDRLLLFRNTHAASSVNAHEAWPSPSSFGYLRLHPTSYGATVAIRKARDAFIIMAARCSLALAVWDPALDLNKIPSWVPFLEHERVPSVWLDVLNASVISKFAHGLRVGAVVDPELCKWLPHIPVMREAKLPIMVRWRTPEAVHRISAQHPYLRQFAPSWPNDSVLALAAPPRPQAPSIYKLYFHGEGRAHPYIKELEERLSPKPCGRFQRPGESRLSFLARMQQHIQQMLAREGAPQRARRQDRETYAATGNIPKPYTRVYLWVKAGVVKSDLPDEWKELDYRAEVHSAVVHSVWQGYGPQNRSYNSAFDEWDLWSDEGEAGAPDAELPLEVNEALNAVQVPQSLASVPGQSSGEAAHSVDPGALFAEENDILYKDITPPTYDLVDFSGWYLENLYFAERYGFHPEHHAVNTSLDYGNYTNSNVLDMFAIGSRSSTGTSFADKDLKTYGGCARAILQDRRNSPVLFDCWDLMPGGRHFLFNNSRVHSVMRVTKAEVEEGQEVLYAVQYHRDRGNLDWTLLVDSRVLVVLLRWADKVYSTEDAVFELSQVGAPFLTAKPRDDSDTSASATLPLPHSSTSFSLQASYRLETYTHGYLDYRQYADRVLDFLRCGPRARAALLRGGIIWRIVTQLGGNNDGIVELIRSYACAGPTDDTAYHRTVARRGNVTLVDDALSQDELDLISGVTKVYTGAWTI